MTLRSTAMRADNVLLFILVWTFTAVCQSDDDVCSVSCEDVSGTVGKEVTLTCSVSQQRSECCFIGYKFQYPEKYDSTICREDLPQGSCEQRNSFTCRYTPTTEMMRQLKFLVQTIKCGPIKTESTVNKADVCSVSCEDVTRTVGKEADLTCSVSQKCTECCIEKYRFYYTEIYNDHKDICRQDLPLDSCEQRNNFTCRYNATKAMTGRFRFLVQTTCGPKRTAFTVDIREHSKLITDTKDPGSTAPMVPGAVVGCFIIIIIIFFIIGMTVFCIKMFKRSKPSGLQMKYERGAPEEPTMTTVNDQNETK